MSTTERDSSGSSRDWRSRPVPVDGLPRSAHQLCQFLLRHVMRDVQPVGQLTAELVAEVQQDLRDSARDVGEDQIRHGLVGAAQTLGQCL